EKHMKTFFEIFESVEPNQGGYIIFRKDGSFEFSNEQPEGMEIIDSNTLEELIFSYCRENLDEFSKTENNREVYAFVLYMEPHYGDVILYLNTESALKKTIDEAQYKDRDKYYRYYGIGDFEYMIDEY